MNFSASIALLAVLAGLIATSKGDEPEPIRAHPQKYFGYWPSYNANIQSLSALNYKLYTDVLFFVAVPGPGLNFTYGDIPVSTAEGMAKEFVENCKKNGVTPLLVFGGFTGSRFFSDLTASDRKREAFAKRLVEYSKQFGFMGMDLSWLYPNQPGPGCNSLNKRDTINFGKLTKEIRKLWPEAQLSAAISVNGLFGADGGPATKNETADLVANVNYVNLISYDFYGPWSDTTGPASAISSKCSPLANDVSVETGLAILSKQGFRPEQITIGIPAYARSFELVNSTLVPRVVDGKTTFYYQNKTSRAIPGGSTDDKPGFDVCGNQQSYGGVWLVQELQARKFISEDLQTGLNGFTRHWDECSGLPFLTNGTVFMTYDDQNSTVAKATLAKTSNLAGLNIFDTTGFKDELNKVTRAALN